MASFEGDIIIGRVAELPTRDQSAALAIAIAQYLQNRARPNHMEEVADLAAEVKKKVSEGDFDEDVRRIIAITKQRRVEYYQTHKREFAPATKVTKEMYVHGQALDAQDMGHILCTGLISNIPYLRRTLPHIDEKKWKQVIEREETRKSYIQQRPYFGHTVFVQKAAVKSDGFGIEPVFERLTTDTYDQSWTKTRHCEPWILDNSEDGVCQHVCAIPFSVSGGLDSLLVFETGRRHISEAQVVHISPQERTLAAALSHMLPSSHSAELAPSSPNKTEYFSWQGVKRTVDFS